MTIEDLVTEVEPIVKQYGVAWLPTTALAGRTRRPPDRGRRGIVGYLTRTGHEVHDSDDGGVTTLCGRAVTGTRPARVPWLAIESGHVQIVGFEATRITCRRCSGE